MPVSEYAKMVRKTFRNFLDHYAREKGEPFNDAPASAQNVREQRLLRDAYAAGYLNGMHHDGLMRHERKQASAPVRPANQPIVSRRRRAKGPDVA